MVFFESDILNCDSDTLALNPTARPGRTRSYLLSAGLRRAGSSRISRRAVAQYTRSRFASPTRFTIRARSSRSMARCAVVNAIAKLSVTPFVVMNGFALKSSTTRSGLLLDSPETFFCHSATNPLMRMARLKASSDMRATPSRKYSNQSFHAPRSLIPRKPS